MTVNIERIQSGVSKVASDFPIKKCFLFGSYAEGSATEDSDFSSLTLNKV